MGLANRGRPPALPNFHQTGLCLSMSARQFMPAGCRHPFSLNDKRGALAAANTPTSQAVEVEEVGSEEL